MVVPPVDVVDSVIVAVAAVDEVCSSIHPIIQQICPGVYSWPSYQAQSPHGILPTVGILDASTIY